MPPSEEKQLIEAVHKAVKGFLELKGWQAFSMSLPRVVKQPGMMPLEYEFTVKFLSPRPK